MKKTFYIQSLKEATPALKDVTQLVNELGEKAAPVVELLVGCLGFKLFKSEDGEVLLKAPKCHSVWGVRAFSKKLITYNDLVAYLMANDEDFEDWDEDEIDEIVEAIAQDPEYPNHVHQSTEIIEKHVRAWLDENCECVGDDGEDGQDDHEQHDEESGDEPEEHHAPCGGIHIHFHN